MIREKPQTRVAYWERNRQGNSALGTLYSSLTDSLLKTNISLSMAKVEFPEFFVYEKKK